MLDSLAVAASLFRAGRPSEAEALVRDLTAQDPENPDGHNNLGGLLLRRGDLHGAVECYRRALAARPDHPGARFNLARTLLAVGDPDGWRLYDERPERLATEARKLGFPEWRGEPLAGKRLFVWTEQGFGDQILAARYLTRTGAAAVTVACHPALVRLFSQLPVSIIERGPQTAVGAHDYWALPLSLPRWCGGEVLEGAYLAVPPARRGGVGVAWRGNALPDPGRSIPSDIAAPLLAHPAAVSLQPEDTGASDFQDTAEIISGLDMVVTIDTSIAHLAGALGKPVYLMLQEHSHDWRWERPWYPHVEVFRQTRQGEWPGVIAQVLAALG